MAISDHQISLEMSLISVASLVNAHHRDSVCVYVYACTNRLKKGGLCEEKQEKQMDDFFKIVKLKECK